MYKQILKFISAYSIIITKSKAINKGIFSDFMKYSPSISPMNLHDFVLHKFPAESFIKIIL